jgi:hypothetical protein
MWAGHTTHVFICAGMLLAVFLGPVGYVIFVDCPRSLRTLISSRIFWIVCLVAITATDSVRYSRHTRLYDQNPNTAAPALVEPAKELAHGHDPYQAHLAEGAPISPGPGWIILLAPLTLSGGVALLLGLVLALCTYLVRLLSSSSAGLVLVLVLMQPVLLEGSFIAHDIFVIPIFFASLCLLAERWVDNSPRLVFLAVIAAAFATSRLPMIILLLILCLGLFRLRPKAGLLFLSISLPFTLLIHGIFYLWTREDHIFYQPFHLFSRGARATNHPLQLIGLLAVMLVAVSLFLRMKARAEDWIAYSGLLLAAAFVPVGLGELRLVHSHYQIWEGANYVSFGASLLAIAVALHYPRQSVR